MAVASVTTGSSEQQSEASKRLLAPPLTLETLAAEALVTAAAGKVKMLL